MSQASWTWLNALTMALPDLWVSHLYAWASHQRSRDGLCGKAQWVRFYLDTFLLGGCYTTSGLCHSRIEDWDQFQKLPHVECIVRGWLLSERVESRPTLFPTLLCLHPTGVVWTPASHSCLLPLGDVFLKYCGGGCISSYFHQVLSNQ